ncbi:CD209 antigen-like protein E isoform X1 [Neomonachus schauinslandi]|uniref:CD209 antigen-like protein E isoform X1 n=1 Tax=Neomonachus schauinslandi TaxID=29088 RepID=A0A2Y9IEN6_NEOSC|nr:CD209 antigen-like protein E isoform X1 [Neomonachus schauinslandi]
MPFFLEQQCPGRANAQEEEIFGGQRVKKKYTGLLRSSRSLPECLTRAQLPLLLLLISLGFFMLLVTILVQVSRIHQSLQKEMWDHQESPSQVGVSQELTRSDLEEILQQLTWMNVTLAGLCRPCPWKWELFQGSCYFFSQTQNVWKDAISACQNLRAQLVIISSTEEQKFLKSWNTRNNQRTWIGLSDHHNEGSWKWVDNSPLQLSFWKEGEPNNHGDEDCVELYSDGWNDNRCSVENFWTCKKPLSPCPGS